MAEQYPTYEALLRRGEDGTQPLLDILLTLAKLIDARCAVLEDVSGSVAEFEAALRERGDALLIDTLTPTLSAFRAAVADLGTVFTARSVSALAPTTGARLTLSVVADDAARFAPAADLAIVAEDNPAVHMLARKVGYDRTTGDLIVDVLEGTGGAVTAGWLIGPAARIGTAAQARVTPRGAFAGAATIQDALDRLSTSIGGAEDFAAEVTGAIATAVDGVKGSVGASFDTLAKIETAIATRPTTGAVDAAIATAVASLRAGVSGAYDTLAEIEAAIGALTAATTASAILAKLVAVDGAGSGLDADRLGGTAWETLAAARVAPASLVGGGTLTVSAAGEVRWSARILATSAGRGAHWSTTGAFEIVCPTAGTVTGLGGAANKTAGAAGIPLAVFETLYFVPPVGGTTSGAADFRVVASGAAAVVSPTWIPLCCRDGDLGGVTWWRGVRVGLGESLQQAAGTAVRPYFDAVTLGAALAVDQGGTGARTPAGVRRAIGLADFNVPKRRRVTGATWLASTSAADNDWRAIKWIDDLGLFVAVAVSGVGNRVMTSPDGITWTSRTSAADNQWRSLDWSPELRLLVAVADSGTGNRVMTSPDGINWTIRASAADAAWNEVRWVPRLGLYVAVGASAVMTSPDGITWTSRTAVAGSAWYSLCDAPEIGLLVAVAPSGTNLVMTSPDGITWTARTAAAANQWRRVRWSAETGLLVALGDSGTGNRVMTSPDGIAWTTRTPAADAPWFGLAWAPEIGLWAAVATNGALMTSPDGVTWTSGTAAAANSWWALTWSPQLGLYAAVAGSGTGNRAMTSVSAHSLTYRS